MGDSQRQEGGLLIEAQARSGCVLTSDWQVLAPGFGLRYPLFQHGGRENDQNLHEFVSLALVQHGLSQDGLSTQHSIFLQIIEATVECATEV